MIHIATPIPKKLQIKSQKKLCETFNMYILPYKGKYKIQSDQYPVIITYVFTYKKIPQKMTEIASTAELLQGALINAEIILSGDNNHVSEISIQAMKGDKDMVDIYIV